MTAPVPDAAAVARAVEALEYALPRVGSVLVGRRITVIETEHARTILAALRAHVAEVGRELAVERISAEKYIEAMREEHALALAESQAECGKLREALEDRGEHEWSCALADHRGGRPRDDGGYEVNYHGVWYETRPVDHTPKCGCELALLSRAPGDREALRAWGVKVAVATLSDVHAQPDMMYAKKAEQIVARLLPPVGDPAGEQKGA